MMVKIEEMERVITRITSRHELELQEVVHENHSLIFELEKLTTENAELKATVDLQKNRPLVLEGIRRLTDENAELREGLNDGCIVKCSMPQIRIRCGNHHESLFTYAEGNSTYEIGNLARQIAKKWNNFTAK